MTWLLRGLAITDAVPMSLCVVGIAVGMGWAAGFGYAAAAFLDGRGLGTQLIKRTMVESIRSMASIHHNKHYYAHLSLLVTVRRCVVHPASYVPWVVCDVKAAVLLPGLGQPRRFPGTDDRAPRSCINRGVD